jgi:DNA-binding GntR family transcriptional regulator
VAPAIPAESRDRTKQQFVYRALRDGIIRCELPPGERLVIDELARRFEVSIIPVREALRLLQSEGLVSNVPHVGVTVAPVSRESILEVFTVLEGLEAVATREAARRATPRDLQELAEILKEMDQALAAQLYESWAELNTRFHLAISERAAMPMLQEMMQRTLSRWDRIRRYYFKGVLVHRADQAQAEHHALVEQLESRDLQRLEQTIRRHNQGAFASYTAYLDAAAADRTQAAG